MLYSHHCRTSAPARTRGPVVLAGPRGTSCTMSEPRATPPWEGLRGPPGVHVWVKRRKVRGLIQPCLSAAEKLVAQDD
jgi:hypothetical protein